MRDRSDTSASGIQASARRSSRSASRRSRAAFALYQLVDRPNDPWFSDVGDESTRGRDALAGAAVDDAAGELRSRLGNDPGAWRWGALHTITFKHPLAIG